MQKVANSPSCERAKIRRKAGQIQECDAMLGNKDEPYDAIIAGAGPGGSATAGYMGRAGLKVLLLEKATFPRDKTCGDAVSGKSMRAMRDFGLIGELEKVPHGRITGVLISSPDGSRADIPFLKNDPNRQGGRGYCVRRMDTDHIFFKAAKATRGVKVAEKFQVSAVIFDGNGKAIGVRGIDLSGKERQEREYYGKMTIGADSVNSQVARSVLGEGGAKLDPKHSCDAVRAYYKGVTGLTGNIEIHFLKSCMPGYFWIFPLENGCANVGLGILSDDLQKMIKKDGRSLVGIMNDAIENDPAIKGRFADAKIDGKLTGWRLPFGSKRRKIAGNGWMLVGDAASLVDPFSGEGIGNATMSGRLAAQVAAKAVAANDFSETALSEYPKLLWEGLGSEMKTSYTMQKLGRWKWLLDMIVRKAGKSQDFRDLLSASLSSEEAKKNFRSPLFYLKTLLMP